MRAAVKVIIFFVSGVWEIGGWRIVEMEKEKSNKHFTMLKILKYIGLFILILLLSGSLYLEASWKVTGLFAVLLFGSVALPRKWKGAFWQVVGIVLLTGISHLHG